MTLEEAPKEFQKENNGIRIYIPKINLGLALPLSRWVYIIMVSDYVLSGNGIAAREDLPSCNPILSQRQTSLRSSMRRECRVVGVPQDFWNRSDI